MSGGQGFEFTPMGIVPLGTDVGTLEGLAGATADVPSAEILRPQTHSGRSLLPAPARKAVEPLKPVDVIKLARKRLRDVEREIRRLHKLEIERDELKRLLDAAAHKPLATVRSLPTRSA